MPRRQVKKPKATDNYLQFASLEEAREFETNLMLSGVSYRTSIVKSRREGLSYVVTVLTRQHSIDDANCWCNPEVDFDQRLIIHKILMN